MFQINLSKQMFFFHLYISENPLLKNSQNVVNCHLFREKNLVLSNTGLE